MSGEPMLSRRRFLVIVGASAGAVVLGRHAYAAPGDGVGRPDAGVSGKPNGGFTPIVVDDGLIDATVWNGSLLTLRNGASGYFVRDEQRGTDHSVDVPENVQVFCVAAAGRRLIVGGHLVRQYEPIVFKSGQPYQGLLANAGAEAQRLMGQPSAPPQPSGFTLRPTSHRPVLLATQDGVEWKQVEVSPEPEPGGTVGAILEDAGVVAVVRYADSADADSGIAVDLLSLENALLGRPAEPSVILPVSHGGLWGSFQGPSGGLIVTSSSDGLSAVDSDGMQAFQFPRGEQLLGLSLADGRYKAAVELPSGQLAIKTIGSGLRTTSRPLTPGERILHGVSPDVLVGSAAGFAKAEAYKPQRQQRAT